MCVFTSATGQTGPLSGCGQSDQQTHDSMLLPQGFIFNEYGYNQDKFKTRLRCSFSTMRW